VTDESVFAAALAIGSPAERAAYLNRACAGNAALRAEVDALLAAHAASNALDNPPADLTGGYAPERAAAPDEAVGAVLAGKYKLVELIGAGGMGAVYMAQQTESVKRLVAVKVIRDGMDTRQVLARFEAERQALALMDHPNIPKVLDAGTTDRGQPFFVMELVKGVPITEFCDARKLSPRERLELFVPVCQAIQHAHQKGVIHRDVKPSNVLVALYDGKPKPKVIDFGVAKAAGQPLTDANRLLGTPAYMSPEQTLGSNIDTRSDVFALGVLLYELLTGVCPFKSDMQEPVARRAEILSKVQRETPVPLIERMSRAARAFDLDCIVMKALNKSPDQRYQSPAEFAADVERYLARQPVKAHPPSALYHFTLFAIRNRVLVAAVCAVLVALLGGLVGTTLALREAHRQTEVARNETIAKEQALAAGRADRDRVASQSGIYRRTVDELAIAKLLRRLLDSHPDVLHGPSGKQLLGVLRRAFDQESLPGVDDNSHALWRAKGYVTLLTGR